VGPRHERRISHHTTIDADLQKVAEDSLRTILKRRKSVPATIIRPTPVRGNFRKAKANGTMSSQADAGILQGAIIGLDNETGGILVLVGGRDSLSTNQYDRLCKLSVLPAQR